MREKLKPGVLVRFKLPNGAPGAFAEIMDKRLKPDAKIPGYAGEGFYFVSTVPDRRELIASQDDLVILCVTCKGKGSVASGYCMCGEGGSGRYCDNHNFVSMDERCDVCAGTGMDECRNEQAQEVGGCRCQ